MSGLTCARCGGVEFVENDGLQYAVCARCGLECEDAQNTGFDDWNEECGQYQTEGGRLMRRQAKKERKKKEARVVREPSFEEATAALGRALDGLAVALFERCGFDVRDTVSALWARFQEVCAEEDFTETEAISPTRQRETSAEIKTEKTARRKRAKKKQHMAALTRERAKTALAMTSKRLSHPDRLPPTRSGDAESGAQRRRRLREGSLVATSSSAAEACDVESLLPLVYLACRSRGLPVSSFDIERWASYDVLPYLTVWTTISDDDRRAFRDKKFFFEPRAVPTADVISLAAELRFAPLLGTAFKPVAFRRLVDRFADSYAPVAAPKAARLAHLLHLCSSDNHHTPSDDDDDRASDDDDDDERASTDPVILGSRLTTTHVPPNSCLGETAAVAVVALAVTRYFDVSTWVFRQAPYHVAEAQPLSAADAKLLPRCDTERLAFFHFVDALLARDNKFAFALEQAEKLADALEPVDDRHTKLSPRPLFTLAPSQKKKTNNTSTHANLPDDLARKVGLRDIPVAGVDAVLHFFAFTVLRCPVAVLRDEIHRLLRTLDAFAAQLPHLTLLSPADRLLAETLFDDDIRDFLPSSFSP